MSSNQTLSGVDREKFLAIFWKFHLKTPLQIAIEDRCYYDQTLVLLRPDGELKKKMTETLKTRYDTERDLQTAKDNEKLELRPVPQNSNTFVAIDEILETAKKLVEIWKNYSEKQASNNDLSTQLAAFLELIIELAPLGVSGIVLSRATCKKTWKYASASVLSNLLATYVKNIGRTDISEAVQFLNIVVNPEMRTRMLIFEQTIEKLRSVDEKLPSPDYHLCLKLFIEGSSSLVRQELCEKYFSDIQDMPHSLNLFPGFSTTKTSSQASKISSAIKFSPYDTNTTLMSRFSASSIKPPAVSIIHLANKPSRSRLWPFTRLVSVGISGVIWLVISASIRRRIHPALVDSGDSGYLTFLRSYLLDSNNQYINMPSYDLVFQQG